MLNNQIVMGSQPDRSQSVTTSASAIISGYPGSTNVQVGIPFVKPEKLLTLNMGFASLPSYTQPDEQLSVCKQYLTQISPSPNYAILMCSFTFADGYAVAAWDTGTFYVSQLDLTTIDSHGQNSFSILRQYITVNHSQNTAYGCIVNINLNVFYSGAQFVNSPQWPYNPQTAPTIQATFLR